MTKVLEKIFNFFPASFATILRLNAKRRLYILFSILVFTGLCFYLRFFSAKPDITIGVLHSLTGTMAFSEAPLVDAIRLAVEETNESGGINGRKVQMIVADCRSDADFCGREAERLISEVKVSVLFGCWTSACRKAVKTVVEKHHHLLFYPLQYEGLEKSPDIIYTGAAPNQQIIPMVLWAMKNKGRRFYLVGSDYIFPRTANLMVKDILLAEGGQLLGERYVPLGGGDLSQIIREVSLFKPDFIVNTLNGDCNKHFFSELYKAAIYASKVPVFSTSIAEVELAAIGPKLVAGHYAAWNYFQSLDNEKNLTFVKNFKRRFGKDRVVDDPIESAYIGVKLWAAVLRDQESTDLALLKTNLSQQTMFAPQGIIAVDFNTGHLWKKVYIGKAKADGQFEIIWQSLQPVHPEPFPFYLTQKAWLAHQEELKNIRP